MSSSDPYAAPSNPPEVYQHILAEATSPGPEEAPPKAQPSGRVVWHEAQRETDEAPKPSAAKKEPVWSYVLALGFCGFMLSMFLWFGLVQGMWAHPTLFVVFGAPLVLVILAMRNLEFNARGALLAVVLGGSGLASVLFVMLGGLEVNPGNTPRQNVVAPSSAPSFQLVRWTYLRSECADGWQSPSIGKQGACSHHGGVVGVYEGSNGQVLRCGGDIPDPPSSERAQRRQLAEFGKLSCSDSAWR